MYNIISSNRFIKERRCMPTIVKQTIDEFTLSKVLPYPIRKQGKEFITRCPFHKDDSPSFNINIDKQIYHCWGCGKSGTLRSLIIELSSKGNVEVPYIIPPDSYKEVPSSNSTDYTLILNLLDKIDPQRANNIRRCGKDWYAAQCTDCDTVGAYKWRCHDRLCPSCRASIVSKWWAEHNVSSSLQNPSLICLRLEPKPFTSSTSITHLRKQSIQMLHTVNRRCRITKGLYSLTTDIRRGQVQITVWLITDADLQATLELFVEWGNLGGLCQLRDCVIDQGISTVMDRFTWVIRHEITCENHFDLQDWLVAFKGKKLIQGFGDLYTVSKPRHGTGFMMKKVACPSCGSLSMNYLGKLSNPTIHRCGKGYKVFLYPTPPHT